MGLELTTDLKREVILAAMAAAGPGADDGQVAGQVTRILNLFEEGSPAMNAFARAEKRAESTTKVKQFTGELVYVDTETTSNRPIVFLRTQVSSHAPEGIEIIRMDRLDSADVDRVKQLANQVLSLIGHKVAVTVAIEQTTSQQNARILRGVEDRGEGGADLAGLTNQHGWRLIDWAAGGKGAFAKIAPKLERLAAYQALAPQPAMAGV